MAPVRIRTLVAVALLATACRPGLRSSPTPLVEAEAAARTALATEQSLQALPAEARTVGVAPLLTADSALAPLGYALADLILTDLSRSAQLQVVERATLHALLRELALSGTGRIDSASAPRTGRLLQASQLVVGAMAPVGEAGLRLDSRVAEVATGRVQLAAAAETRLVDVLDAEKELVMQIFERLGVTLTPAELARVQERPTASLAALLAYGRAVRYEVEGLHAPAATEYARAARLDPDFELAQVRFHDLRAHADVWPLPVMPVTGQPRGFTATTGTLGSSMVDRVNPTYPFATASGDSRAAADPVFPVTHATVILTIVLP